MIQLEPASQRGPHLWRVGGVPPLSCDLACGRIFQPTRRLRSFSMKCNRATPARS